MRHAETAWPRCPGQRIRPRPPWPSACRWSARWPGGPRWSRARRSSSRAGRRAGRAGRAHAGRRPAGRRGRVRAGGRGPCGRAGVIWCCPSRRLVPGEPVACAVAVISGGTRAHQVIIRRACLAHWRFLPCSGRGAAAVDRPPRVLCHAPGGIRSAARGMAGAAARAGVPPHRARAAAPSGRPAGGG